MTEDVTAAEAAPTCYRHPGRETYVRCTRCDRPICPDCMTEAAVGFQCPECVREGNKSVRQPRTTFGGRVPADAYVTKALIAINVVAFVAQLASSAVTDRFLMDNAAVWRHGEFYRMLTSAFLHDTGFVLPIHLAFNMYGLLLFGSQVERLLGGVRYLVLYLIAGFGGSVAYLLFVPYGASLGASGAVFGLFGAYFVFARKMRADTSQLVYLIGLNLFIGLTFHGINNYAHVGGLLTGALVALLYTRVPRGRWQAALQLGGAAAVALVLVVVTVVRSNDLRQDPPPPPARSESSALSTSGTGAPSR